METEILPARTQTSTMKRMISAIVPILLIAIGYVDPGKWVAVVEGGAHFGSDFILPMLLFNFAAVLCQYLSASIAVVTGKNLAQICRAEYDLVTCIFLGVQAELSMIALDLSMILSTAHGLNLLFGMDLFTCVFLTSVEVVLFRILSNSSEVSKIKVLCLCLASFILLSYLFGAVTSHPDVTVSMGGIISKLSRESTFSLMSLLGANIMPHNFYLHSSIVQQDQGPGHVSKGTLCHDHFFAILSIFSGIFMVNYMLMNTAANVFYSTGLDLLTFQDAFSIINQVFRSLLSPFALVLMLLLSSQTSALTWKLGGPVVIQNFFKIEIPSWIHHATVRVIAITTALCCVWNSGAEGTYEMLIITQIVVALLLPSSVIPIFRVASSKSVMGLHKISQFLEILVLITFLGMLGLEIIFVMEMLIGDSDWANNIRCNEAGNVSISYVVLVVTASVSLCLMLCLAATPLRSASSRPDALSFNLGIQGSSHKSSKMPTENTHSGGTDCGIGNSQPTQEPILAFESEKHRDLSIPSCDLNLPDTQLSSESESHSATIEENSSDFTFPSSLEDSSTTVEMVPCSAVPCEVSNDVHTMKTGQEEAEEKILGTDVDSKIVQENEGDSVEAEKSSIVVSESSTSLALEGPGSFRSLGGKNNDLGSGAASLSKLVGLGRAARRQLTAILDDFWGQLFDFHGQVTQDAKVRKLDELLGIDSKVTPKPASATSKKDIAIKEYEDFIPPVGGTGFDALINPSLYDSPRQQAMKGGLESSYRFQMGSSSPLSNHIQLLDAYNDLDGERRYSSLRFTASSNGLRIPPASSGYDYQPATIHGYQIKSYVNQLAKERSCDYLKNQLEFASPQLVSPNYKAPLTNLLYQNPKNGLTPAKPPGFPDPVVSRINSLQSERVCSHLGSSGTAESISSSVYAKKYHSMPDVSGLYLPNKDSLLSSQSPIYDSPKYGTLGRKMYEKPLYSSASLRTGSHLGIHGLTSNVNDNVYPSRLLSGSDTWSMWSRQPFEQFGVAENVRNAGEVVGSSPKSNTQETPLLLDFEAKLLQSLRHCIVKLLKLEGSDWLFKQNGGLDEDLIDSVAARETFLYEIETKEMNQGGPKVDVAEYTKYLVTSVPNCGEGCVWRVDLITSFGVWCIHRVLELALMESRPELWGKYTYVLNRLQGIVDLAFSKPRTPMNPCFCLQLPISHQQKSSPLNPNASLPPPAKHAKGKCTTASVLLDIVKDVEIAISCRKGRSGTAAGDVAFPKGKENLASVLKRYKRRLSKPAATPDVSSGPRKVQVSAPYGIY